MSAPTSIQGVCRTMFAFDVGFQIDLDAAAKLLADASRQRVIRARRPAPVWFDYHPPPLRLSLDGPSVQVGGSATEKATELIIYDFGAALVNYRLPLPPTLQELPDLSVALYQNAELVADATSRVQECIQAIRAAIERPRLNTAVEDYTVYAITAWEGAGDPEAFVHSHRALIARTIEAEAGQLSSRQALWSTSGRLAYGPMDLAIVDWNAAILFDEQPDDVVALLQHANVELLELRVLDDELDQILDHADEALSRLVRRRVWPVFRESAMLRRFATVQTDAAVMFEGINNAIKLLGNQYLARLYRLAADRLDVPAWQASVQRKLATTESVYQKMSDASAGRRLETLEWVIILLITLSIVLTFVGVH